MAPTRFWYSAYPSLTTDNIRTNADIRRGLSGAMTEEEADTGLPCSGRRPAPAAKLVSSEIQSIVFGGLGFMPFGTCLVCRAAREGRRRARDGCRSSASTSPSTTAGGCGATAIVTLALGARGLERLGLPEEGLATFPFALLDGMTSDWPRPHPRRYRRERVRALALGPHRPRRRAAGLRRDAGRVAGLEERLRQSAADLGMAASPHSVAPGLDAQKDAQKGDDDPQKNKREPFGFVDGISQPVIRGTYKGLRNADPIHLVEPGEFILGYPDNRGNIPPGPTLRGDADPANKLPLVSGTVDFSRTVVENQRDIGCNGSFLVIRELEQDVEAFWDYCGREAARLVDRLPQPYDDQSRIHRGEADRTLDRWLFADALPLRTADDRGEAREGAHDRELGPAAAAQAVAPAARRNRAAEKQASNGRVPADRAAFRSGLADRQRLPVRHRGSGSAPLPFGAHIRRANPRDSLDPGSQDQIDISNRHRVIRVGRPLDPEQGQTGLLFMCLNGDIERQFEFLQQSWLRSPSFHGLSCEKDPVLGDGEAGVCSYTIPTRDGPVRLSPMPRFVTTKGGGYFFLPGKRLVEYLCAPL